jgi:hypothetical protein
VSPATIAIARGVDSVIFGMVCSNSMKLPSVTILSVATTARGVSPSLQSAAMQTVTGRTLSPYGGPIVRGPCVPAPGTHRGTHATRIPDTHDTPDPRFQANPRSRAAL